MSGSPPGTTCKPDGAELKGCAFRLVAAQMFVKSRHDLDEVAGPVAVVELVHQDFVPGIAAGAGGARQAKNVSAVGKPGGGARLNRRGADFLKAHHQEQRREGV